MKYKACILAVVLIVLVSGVVGSYLQQKIVCEGEDCCVDANENEQCDPD